MGLKVHPETFGRNLGTGVKLMLFTVWQFMQVWGNKRFPIPSKPCQDFCIQGSRWFEVGGSVSWWCKTFEQNSSKERKVATQVRRPGHNACNRNKGYKSWCFLLLFHVLPLLLGYGFRHILVVLQSQTDRVRTFLRGSISTTDPE